MSHARDYLRLRNSSNSNARRASRLPGANTEALADDDDDIHLARYNAHARKLAAARDDPKNGRDGKKRDRKLEQQTAALFIFRSHFFSLSLYVVIVALLFAREASSVLFRVLYMRG